MYFIESKKRYQKWRTAGGLTLAFALLLPIIMLLLFSLVERSRMMRDEVDAVRYARQSADLALASYDRDMYQTLGLFALQEINVQGSKSDFLLPSGYEDKISLQKSLYEKDVLCDSICRHMTVRGLASIIEEASARLNLIKSESRPLDTALSEIDCDLLEQLDPEIEGEGEWQRKCNQYIDDKFRDAYHKSLLQLQPVFVPDPETGGASEKINPYTNSGLENFAQAVDRIFFVLPQGPVDKVILCEYVLSYFGSKVPFLKSDGVKYYRTPDGRLLKDFADSRQSEEEIVATGINDGAKAAKRVQSFIKASRSVHHLADTLQSDSKRRRFEIAGSGISTTITVISLGYVNIPPEAITTILILLDSFRKGRKDSRKLCRGKLVRFNPGDKDSILISYRDYLRLLIITQPKNLLLERIAMVIKNIYADDYFIEVVCEVKRPASRVRLFRPEFNLKIKDNYLLREDFASE